jgi:uncharacterized membrane protein YcaP (DUF421 family)
MESVIRGAVIYLFLFVLFRLVGKRALSQITTFDFVLLLIVSEATQQAMLGQDDSLTNAFVVVCTLASVDLGLSYLKHWSPRLESILDGQPVRLIDEGRVLDAHLDRERVDRDDIREAAREEQGIASLEEIRYAVLERSGRISVVPHRSHG